MRPITVIAACALALVAAAPAGAGAPEPCGGQPQITDVERDGHHENTDVTAAWLSEAGGRLQAVIRVRNAVWEPAHDDSDAAGLAFLYVVDGVRRYVRVEAPRGAAPHFDHGTWSASGGFASAGSTTGETAGGASGTATIDVPALPSGTRLTQPFVLTYDGGDAVGPHWVDRAPGGVTPDGTELGADYVVGGCAVTPGGGGAASGPTTTAVLLDAPARRRGGGTTTVRGRIVPATAGVPVVVEVRGAKTKTVRTVLTGSDGGFSAGVPVGETSRVTAVADGLSSQTRTVVVASTITYKIRRTAAGGVRVSGVVRPKLPGRVLWLRDGAAHATAVARTKDGRFVIRLKHPRPGRYQAVFLPSARRAERALSKTGVIR